MITRISFLLILFFFAANFCNAQTFSIKGRVVDAANGLSLPKATVYINNSTRVLLADDSGYFKFTLLPVGTYEIIISYVGYKTILQQVKLTNADHNGLFQLNLKQTELRGVLILSNSTRQKYMNLLRKNLLGYTYDAGKCIIKNPGAVQFVQGKFKDDILVYAEEPLEIENPVLGYTIYFNVVEVYFNTVTSASYFFGYTRFTDWIEREGFNKKWIRNRLNVYLGSSMHFFRSLVQKNLQRQGFMIQKIATGLTPLTENRISIQPNGTDATVSNMRFSGGTIMKPLPEDSIIRSIEENNYQQFELLLQPQVYIKYNRNTELKLQLSKVMPTEGQPENTTITGLRLKKAPILIDYRGILLTPMNVYFDGIWAYERLANMLPEDYKPEK